MKKLFYLLLALPLAFAACNETEEPTPQPEPEKNPQLIRTSDAEMSFKAEGGKAFGLLNVGGYNFSRSRLDDRNKLFCLA